MLGLCKAFQTCLSRLKSTNKLDVLIFRCHEDIEKFFPLHELNNSSEVVDATMEASFLISS